MAIGLLEKRREVGGTAAFERDVTELAPARIEARHAPHPVVADHHHQAGLETTRDRLDLGREASHEVVVDRPRDVDDHGETRHGSRAAEARLPRQATMRSGATLVGQVRARRSRPRRRGTGREPAGEPGPQHLLPRGPAARQVGAERPEHRERRVVRVRAEQAFAPLARQPGLAFRRVQQVLGGLQVGDDGGAERAGCGGFRTVATIAAVSGPAVVDGAVEAFDVPGEQRLLRGRTEPQRPGDEVVQVDRPGREAKPGQMAQRAVDDRVGADVEQPQVDVAEQTLQVAATLCVAEGNMQDLVRDEAGLLVEVETLEARTVADRRSVGRDQ